MHGKYDIDLTNSAEGLFGMSKLIHDKNDENSDYREDKNATKPPMATLDFTKKKTKKGRPGT